MSVALALCAPDDDAAARGRSRPVLRRGALRSFASHIDLACYT